jgi:hypothetical protein
MIFFIYMLIGVGLYEYLKEKHPEEKWITRLEVALLWPWAIGQELGAWMDRTKVPSTGSSGND